MFFGCREKNIDLAVEWRPRNHYLLEHADQGSKSFDSSSFSLDFESYAAMLSYFQEIRIEVDCFAEFWNRKAPVYFSRYEEERDQAGTSPGSQMQDSQGVGEEKMLVFIGSFVALIAF